MAVCMTMCVLCNQDTFESIFPPRESLLPCIKQAFDKNNDGKITPEEINSELETHKLIYEKIFLINVYNATLIMKQCDVNEDGVLDAVDWDANVCVSSVSNPIRSLIKKICDQIQ